MARDTGSQVNRDKARAAVAGSRSQTIRQIVEQHVAKHGAEPTDAEIGAILAISPSKVKRYRRRLGR